MSFRSLLCDPVTIVTPGVQKDAYNNDVPDWSPAAVRRESLRGRYDETSTTEVTIDRDTVVTDGLLFLPPEAVLDAHCRIEIPGQTLEVIGKPNLVPGRRAPHHYEVHLRQVEG